MTTVGSGPGPIERTTTSPTHSTQSVQVQPARRTWEAKEREVFLSLSDSLKKFEKGISWTYRVTDYTKRQKVEDKIKNFSQHLKNSTFTKKEIEQLKLDLEGVGAALEEFKGVVTTDKLRKTVDGMNASIKEKMDAIPEIRSKLFKEISTSEQRRAETSVPLKTLPAKLSKVRNRDKTTDSIKAAAKNSFKPNSKAETAPTPRKEKPTIKTVKSDFPKKPGENSPSAVKSPRQMPEEAATPRHESMVLRKDVGPVAPKQDQNQIPDDLRKIGVELKALLNQTSLNPDKLAERREKIGNILADLKAYKAPTPQIKEMIRQLKYWANQLMDANQQAESMTRANSPRKTFAMPPELAKIFEDKEGQLVLHPSRSPKSTVTIEEVTEDRFVLVEDDSDKQLVPVGKAAEAPTLPTEKSVRTVLGKAYKLLIEQTRDTVQDQFVPKGRNEFLETGFDYQPGTLLRIKQEQGPTVPKDLTSQKLSRKDIAANMKKGMEYVQKAYERAGKPLPKVFAKVNELLSHFDRFEKEELQQLTAKAKSATAKATKMAEANAKPFVSDDLNQYHSFFNKALSLKRSDGEGLVDSLRQHVDRLVDKKGLSQLVALQTLINLKRGYTGGETGPVVANKNNALHGLKLLIIGLTQSVQGSEKAPLSVGVRKKIMDFASHFNMQREVRNFINLQEQTPHVPSYEKRSKAAVEAEYQNFFKAFKDTHGISREAFDKLAKAEPNRKNALAAIQIILKGTYPGDSQVVPLIRQFAFSFDISDNVLLKMGMKYPKK